MEKRDKRIEIMKIGPDDYLALSELLEWRRSGREEVETVSYQAEHLRQFMQRYQVLESDTFFIYAAKINDKLVGYINAILIPKPDPRRGIMYVDELWTAPPYRGLGVAGALLETVIGLAERLELWRVRLYVDIDNDSARACYRKAGFAEKGECLFLEVNLPR